MAEGVSFGLHDGWRTLGANVSELSVVGGGARSTFWVQLLASALNLPLLTHSSSEAGGALGAARLAWLADGGSEAEVCLRPPVATRYVPDAAVLPTSAAAARPFCRALQRRCGQAEQGLNGFAHGVELVLGVPDRLEGRASRRASAPAPGWRRCRAAL